MSAAVSIYIYDHTPSGQSRLYRVTQLRTDGVHCRESVVSKHNHCCTAAVRTVDPFFPPDLCCCCCSIICCVSKHTGVQCTAAVHYGPVFTPPTYACQRAKNLLYGTISYVVFQKHSYYYCTVHSFLPSRLLSVQKTPCMSTAWKTILKQVC